MTAKRRFDDARMTKPVENRSKLRSFVGNLQTEDDAREAAEEAPRLLAGAGSAAGCARLRRLSDRLPLRRNGRAASLLTMDKAGFLPELETVADCGRANAPRMGDRLDIAILGEVDEIVDVVAVVEELAAIIGHGYRRFPDACPGRGPM
jgi:hypothetical protein